MENLYNTIFIVDISQNPDEVETVSSRIQQLIEDHGGVIKKINRWGKKRLSYLIRKRTHGFYVEIEYTAASRLNIPVILENEFRLNDRVLRYLSYVVSKEELIQREKTSGKDRREESPAEPAPKPAREKEEKSEPEKEAPAAEEPKSEPATASGEEKPEAPEENTAGSKNEQEMPAEESTEETSEEKVREDQ
ncbi:MAG: 30S ribosomal protein S6 [Calditrichia bacterium]